MATSSVRFLGTGTAFHDDARGSACTLVTPAAGPAFLVDVGPTAACNVVRFEADSGSVDQVFFTHLHGDHTAGWPFLLLQLALGQGRTRPLDVHGPEGVRATLEGLCRLCYGELLDPPAVGFEIRYHEHPVREASDVEAGGSRFDVLPMEHHPSSVGYRFALGEAKVAFSGDTAWCAGLERLGRGSDLLVTECTFLEPQPERAHLSLDEIRRGRERLGGDRVALVHLTDDVAAALALDPIERVIATYDGLELELD